MLRASLLVAGLWLGFVAASWVMATANFRTADRVAGAEARPEAAARLSPLPAEDRRLVLRYLASEINRFMFRTWAGVQLVLGALLVAQSWRLGGAPRALALVALGLVLLQAFGLTAPMTAIGRGIDFMPRPLPPEVGRRFGMLHGAYVLADVVKGGVLAALAFLLLRRP